MTSHHSVVLRRVACHSPCHSLERVQQTKQTVGRLRDAVWFVVPNECDSDVACELELVLRFATTGPNSSFDGPVELEPTLDVLIAYPITDRVPERADLEVALEHRA